MRSRTCACSLDNALSLASTAPSEPLGNRTRVKCLLLSRNHQADKTSEICSEKEVPLTTGAQRQRPGNLESWGTLNFQYTLPGVPPLASSVGLAVNPASCAWLLGLLETLWEKLCLGLCVLSCPQRKAHRGQLPSTAIFSFASPHDFSIPAPASPPTPHFQDPAKKSDNFAIGAWG